MSKLLLTDRLMLEPVHLEHAEFLIDLCADPEVMRYLGKPISRHEMRSVWLPRWMAPYPKDLGYWVGFRGAQFVGLFILRPHTAEQGQAEIGWRTAVNTRGSGYATEAARELLRHGFEQALDLVWAETMAINAASRKVMERLGMRLTETWVGEWADPIPGWEQGEVRYEINALA